ncbi:MAG: hypothetical protein PHG95_00960 [Patescibacteria group bacterium]|nr:hypothetical protein [Patescibacteria group bacterium]
MFKCEWLKKLLGMKKECCCHSGHEHAEASAPAASNDNIVSASSENQEEASLK